MLRYAEPTDGREVPQLVGGSTGADVAQKAATEAADDHASRDERGKPRWRTAARLAMAAILAGMVAIYHRDLVRWFGRSGT